MAAGAEDRTRDPAQRSTLLRGPEQLDPDLNEEIIEIAVATAIIIVIIRITFGALWKMRIGRKFYEWDDGLELATATYKDDPGPLYRRPTGGSSTTTG